MKKSFFKVVLGIVFVFLLLGAGYYFGSTAAKAVCVDEKNKVIEANQKTLAEAWEAFNDRLTKQRELSKKVVSDYEQELEQSKNYNVGRSTSSDRLRISSSICNKDSLPSTPGNTERVTDPYAGTVVLPKKLEEDLWELTREADRVTAQCRAIMELE